MRQNDTMVDSIGRPQSALVEGAVTNCPRLDVATQILTGLALLAALKLGLLASLLAGDYGCRDLYCRDSARDRQPDLEYRDRGCKPKRVAFAGHRLAGIPGCDSQAQVLCECPDHGGQIQARAWELLLAMLVMEAIFGIPGVVAAPIYYAYLKNELSAQNLI